MCSGTDGVAHTQMAVSVTPCLKVRDVLCDSFMRVYIYDQQLTEYVCERSLNVVTTAAAAVSAKTRTS